MVTADRHVHPLDWTKLREFSVIYFVKTVLRNSPQVSINESKNYHIFEGVGYKNIMMMDPGRNSYIDPWLW